MGLLKNIIGNAVGNAVSEGISKGIRNAVSSAAEKIVAPKAEAYANSVASQFEKATEDVEAINAARSSVSEETLSSFEQSLNRLSKSAEQYAKAMESAAEKYEEKSAGLSEWNEKLAGFPVWCFGGKDFSIEKNFTDENTGTTYYYFNAVGATYEDMCAYVNILKADGFAQKYKDSDQVLYKDLGGEYLVFSSVEAFNDLDVMSVGMFRTKYFNEV